MKIAAAYIRVSTEDQTEYSPDSQLKMIKDFAEKNGYLILDRFIFADEGISGRKAKKRPAFMEMISKAKQKPKPFDAIIVWKFSRFARSREDSIVYKSMLKKQCGIEVVSVSEPIGDDKTSILIEALLEAMDEYYSINLAEEVKRGMTEKAERGEPQTTAPFGYYMNNKKLFVNEKEAETVKMIFKDFLNGKSFREIASEINDIGIKTHRGNKFEARNVEYIINNPVYIGKIRWNPAGKTKDYTDKNLIVADGNHEKIISGSVWNDAQRQIAENKKNHRKYDKPFVFSNMLQGLVRCSSCGATLIKSGKYLQCQKYTKGKCNVSHAVLYEKIEEKVIETIEKDFTTKNLKVSSKCCSNEKANLIKLQIKKEEKKLARAKEAYQAGIDTLKEYKENKDEITSFLSKLKDELLNEENLKNKNSSVNPPQNKIEKLRDPALNLEEKNKFLRSFVQKIVYDKSDESLRFTYYI